MIEAAISPDGALADEYLAKLERSKKTRDREELADILTVFQDYAYRDCLDFPREINNLVDGVRELKAGTHRFPFFHPREGSEFAARLTHGFRKGDQKTSRQDIAKAKWVRREDLKP